MLDLHAGSRAQLARLADRAPETGALSLDPADDEHRELLTNLLEACGKTSDRYPALHEAIAAGASNGYGDPGDGVDDCTIIDMGKDSSGRATARSWLASRGKAFVSGAVVLVLDAESGDLLASGGATQVGGTLAQAATKADEAQPASKAIRAITLFHAQTTPETPPRFGLVAATMLDADDDGVTINVTDPAPVKLGGPRTKIGLSRDKDHQRDVDYAYLTPMGINPEPDRLVVPFTGNAQLTTPIDSSRSITVLSKLYVRAARAWVSPRTDFPLAAGYSGSDYQVTWSYPPDGLDIADTKSIQYGLNDQANDTETDFFFQFKVPLKGSPGNTITFTVCSDDTPDEPSIHCQKVRDLQYWWHCVGEDTAVTLADGTEAPIALVDNSATVRTGIGDACASVGATSRAHHTDNDGREPARRLVTEGGRSLLLSHLHPVITPDGPVAAVDLTAGSTVLTADGEDRVTSCEPEPYDGIVYNLQVPEGHGGVGSFVANGIVVGDHDALGAHDRATRMDPDYMLPRLPESHHRDYLSALADSTAR